MAIDERSEVEIYEDLKEMYKVRKKILLIQNSKLRATSEEDLKTKRVSLLNDFSMGIRSDFYNYQQLYNYVFNIDELVCRLEKEWIGMPTLVKKPVKLTIVK